MIRAARPDDLPAIAGIQRSSPEAAPWDPTGYPVLRYSEPIRPPEIINARSVRVAPLLVGGLLVLAATIGLAVAIVISVRARRREMAVLRTLGFTSRQLRISVRVQALAMMLGGFVVGAPIGIAVGRIAWRAFASQLGVVTVPSTPIVWIVATAVGLTPPAGLATAPATQSVKGALDSSYDAFDATTSTWQTFSTATVDISKLSDNASDLAKLETYIGGVDKALGTITDAATNLGAIKNRIGLQQNFVKTLTDSLDRGIGQLVDADMNAESTRLQALQVQQQLGIQALSIANSGSQSILSLFK